jgi:hypothetical protein
VTPAGLATFRSDGVLLQAELEGWTGIQGGAFEFGARTSGVTDTNVFTDRHWIDDLRIETTSFLPGTFAGLLLEEQSPARDRSGYVTLKLNASGVFSGTLRLAGKRLPLTGTFNPTNRLARASVPRTGSAALTLDLQLTDADAVEGRVSDGVWEVPLRADRQVWSKQSRPLPAFLATRHTFYLPASDQPDLAPGGHGIGTLRVDAGGVVTLSGRLGEGTPVTQRVAVSKTGFWPFYVSFQGGKGAAFGWIQARQPDELFGFSGRVTVTKVPDARAARYPSGFTQETALLAAPYAAPASGTPALSVSNTVVSFSGGNLGYDFASQIALTQENKILDLGTNSLKMKLSPASGVYSGTVVNPSTGRSLSFRGIVLRPPGLAPGQFLGATESGGVALGDSAD